MRQAFRVFLLLAALLGPVAASTARATGHDAATAQAQAVINAQIAAFLADDLDAAFALASPTIRAIFVTPEGFGQMVRTGYPMVYRPSSVRFLDSAQRPGLLIQRVLVTDAAGRGHVLEYQMQGAGEAMRINGVRIVPPAGASV